ncbi:MAG: hypothetical protein ISR65_02515 [Bacteriovoracaceae bacterium]|nr:hypothetical protein [Bacteriovoracaceae bacterium]
MTKNLEHILSTILAKKTNRILLAIVSVGLGLFISLFTVFQVLFLAKVLPHGGLW